MFIGIINNYVFLRGKGANIDVQQLVLLKDGISIFYRPIFMSADIVMTLWWRWRPHPRDQLLLQSYKAQRFTHGVRMGGRAGGGKKFVRAISQKP